MRGVLLSAPSKIPSLESVLSPPVPGNSSKDSAGFSLSRCQPVISGIRGIRRSTFKGQKRGLAALLMLVAGSALLLGATLLIASVSGTLTPSWDFPLFVTNLIVGDSDGRIERIGFPRDYVWQIFLCLIVSHALYTTHQWGRLERLPRMWSAGGLLPDSRTQSGISVQDAFKKMSTASCRWRQEVLASLLALCSVAGIDYWLVNSHQLYPTLDRDTPGAQRTHYQTWWANPGEHLLAHGWFLFLLACFLYLVWRHTVMGCQVLVLLGRLRAVERDDPGTQWFGYQEHTCSVSSREIRTALRETRRGVGDVGFQAFVSLLCFFLGVVLFGPPIWLVGVTVVYFLYDLSVFVIPAVMFDRRISASREYWSDYYFDTGSDAKAVRFYERLPATVVSAKRIAGQIVGTAFTLTLTTWIGVWLS